MGQAAGSHAGSTPEGELVVLAKTCVISGIKLLVGCIENALPQVSRVPLYLSRPLSGRSNSS